MADDLTRPYIGYRSAGRRPERQQDRRASADAPLAALRGMVSGVLGAPGDIESLVRMLPGLSEQTVLPTSEDVERRLPLRSVSETPAGRAFTTAGQLGGGFYTGPGSPLRAIAGLPSAVSRAGRDFAMAAGQPAVNVVKPKGGNWLAGSVERAIEPMRTVDPAMMDVLRNADPRFVDQTALNRVNAEGMAIDKWLESKLAKYIKNEMATPEDPLRALAEKGVLHTEVAPTSYYLKGPRAQAGFPEEGMGVSPLAKAWEDKADTFINELRASDITQGYPGEIEKNPWLLKVPPETRVYDMLRGADEDLGFSHLADELKNAINPASGLPENLRWKYSDLDKVTVPQAVERVAKINEWRAAQKAEADMARAMGPATQVVKEYPEQGFKWVELRQPEVKELPEGYSVKPMERDGKTYYAVWEPPSEGRPQGRSTGAVGKSPEEAIANQEFGRISLEDALKYEGETMGHCVGGYCPDVIEGRSKIFSLRDKKGQPHVTIEVAPSGDDPLAEVFRQLPREEQLAIRERALGPEAAPMDKFVIGPEADRNRALVRAQMIKERPELADLKPAEEIVQIKGKANRAPNPEYLPAVQDFVRSQNWSNVGDLKNTGLVDLQQMGVPAEMRGGQRFVTEDEYKDIVRKNAEGFAEGGLVGGANSPTLDFDPARIDTIVGELHALNAG